MGIVLPQLAPASEDRVSGAQVIDGSLKFRKDNSTYLIRTPSSAGNRSVYTGSVWVKRTQFAPENNSNSNVYNHILFSAGTDTTNNIDNIRFYKNAGSDSNAIEYGAYPGSYNYLVITNAKFRDPSGWYNVVWNYYGTKAKHYINGVQQTDLDTNTQNGGSNGHFNNTVAHVIGRTPDLAYNGEFDGYMSQFYWIDGLSLGPGYFGYVDPLTNTWRPKKFRAEGTTVNDGTVWSSGIPGNTLSGYPATNAFNGNTSNYVYADNGTTMTWTAPKRITGQLIEVYVYAGNLHPIVKVNGQSTGAVVGGAAQQNVWVDVTDLCGGPGGSLQTIQAFGQNIGGTDRSSGFAGVRVDGVTLIDSTTTNLDFGTNGFYLPMDGNSPIGQDQSGKGNNWKPVNFGGSVALDNPQVSGARPILNTLPGGTQAGVGVFGSKENAFYTATGSSGSGSGYVFDGVAGNNPSFSFIRGATYTFDYSAASGHPLRFSSTDPDSSTTAYTTGTNTATSNVIKFTVPHDAPDNLWYYCTNHSNMNGAISVTTDETKADKYASNCSVALPSVGLSGSNGTLFGADVSDKINVTTTEIPITSIADAHSSNDRSNFYSESFEFDGTGDWVISSSSSDLAFGTGDFTIECWVFQTSAANAEDGIFQISTNGLGIDSTNSNTVTLQTNSGTYRIYANDTSTAMSSPVITDKWVHLAVVRNSGTTKLFVNGIEDATTISDTRDYTGSTLAVGAYYSSSYLWVGYIQDFRVYKGVAKYTSNFVVPATFPDILPDSPSGISGSSKLTKITDGAVSFDGSGDYLTLAQSNDFDLTGDYTYEAFIYYTDTSGNPTIFDFSAAASNYEGRLQIQAGILNIYDGGWQSRGAISANTWHHIAVTQAKVYVDGIDVGASSGSVSGSNYKVVTIGARTNNGGTSYGDYFTGQISNVRIVNGTALYTSNFTPPTRALTNVTNTKLLCCQSNIQAGSAAVAPNVSGVNDGREWSHFTSAVGGFNGSYPKYNLFDGESPADSNRAEAASNDTPINISFDPPITVSSTISLWSGKSSTRYQINDSGSYTAYSDAVGSYKDISHSGSLSNIKILHGSSGQAAGISAIKIDGTQLKDPTAVNGNTSANNFNPFITDIDAVRGQESGYCTLNPLAMKSSGGSMTNGNLNGSVPADSTHHATFAIPNSGKYYFEAQMTNSGTLNFGLAAHRPDGHIYTNPNAIVYSYSGVKNVDAVTDQSYGASWSKGDAIGCACDADAGTITFYKNGVSQGALSHQIGELFPSFGNGGTTSEYSVNFGQKPFKFPPPDGFQPLSNVNVRPNKVITRPDKFVGIATYAGNSTGQFITMGMKPDFLWIKSRTNTGSHAIQDSVRGSAKQLQSNTTNGESTNSATAGVLSFDLNGYTLGTESSATGSTNGSQNYVAWGWKAGGNKGTFNVDDKGFANASDVGMNIGGQNSNAYNQTTLWRNSTTTTDIATNTGNDINSVFDGRLDTGTRAASNGGTGILQWAIGTIQGKVRIYLAISSTSGITYIANGIQTTISSAPTGWLDLGNVGLTELKFTYNNSGITFVNAIEVDGKILVDSDVTPPNLPSIAATGCSVGTKQGFSIVTYQGTTSNETIPHALGSVPAFYICKATGSSGYTDSWNVYHQSLGNSAYLKLQSSDDATTGSTIWEGKSPNTSVFYVSSGSNANENGVAYVSYIWADVPGLQKFGSYIGNGNADGPLVFTGHKVALLMIKNTATNGTHWTIIDSTRNKFNLANNKLLASSNSEENGSPNNSSTNTVDLLSDGFKCRTDNGDTNASGITYIYAAWAEAPTVNLYGGQSNAR